MEEVCRVNLKNLRTNFRVEEVSQHEMFLVIFRCRKTLVMSAPKQIILCNYFERLFVCLSDEYFTKFIPSKSLNFFPVPLFIVLLAGQKFEMKEIFVAINIAVSVL